MTGYVGTKFAESYGIVVDYVDAELTELVRVRIPLLDALLVYVYGTLMPVPRRTAS
jgi:hypothetical protein